MFHFLKSIVLLLYYFIRAKGLQPVLCVFCTATETGSSELFSLFLFAYPPPQPKWPNRLPLIGSWFPASATSSYIFLTINLNSYQSSHSWRSGTTCVLWSLPWSLHLEAFTPFCQFLLLYQSGSSQKNNPLQLFYQREFNQEFV